MTRRAAPGPAGAGLAPGARRACPRSACSGILAPDMRKLGDRAGQTLVEYAIVFAALLGVAAVLTCLLSAAKRDSVRTSALVGSEYP